LRLLAVNLALAPEGTALQPVLQLASLASRMLSAALYVEGVDTLMRDPSCAGFATLMQAFADTGVAILSGTLPWHPTPRGPAGVLSLDFGALDLHAARECWLEQTGRRGISLPDSDLNLMAGRFRLTAEQIADAVACAENAVRWSSQSALTLDHLAAAARAECGHELAKLARKQGQQFESAAWLHKARRMPKEEFKREVDRELTGKDSEPSELIYFKVYKSQIQVIEQAIETAALMLGSDKSRGYCLEMICADFLAGTHLDGDNPEILLQSISRYYKFLPTPQQEIFLSEVSRRAS